EAAGFYLRRSEDRKVGRETNITGEPENLAEEARSDLAYPRERRTSMNCRCTSPRRTYGMG
ncbi:MAG: hypothetical protein M3Q62_12630, partial [Actinomycetota bacterium]|nr:hypothetical protein [Actinomycetota bacterium]